MAEKFDTQLIEKIPRGDGCASFRFGRPAGFEYTAGQFHFVTLHGNGALRKPFSFSSSPTEDFLEMTTRLSGSDFKKALDSHAKGDTVTMEAPYGQFTLREGMNKVAFLSGGIGIAPIRGIVKYVTDTGADVSMVLIYGNHHANSIVFREDLDGMSGAHAGLKVVYCVSDPPGDWQGCRGRVTAETVTARVEGIDERLFYICGPPPMVEAMRALLTGLGVEPARVVLEQFAGY